VHPLTVYLYTDGLARFCTDLYEAPEEENLEMREMHLTNFSINWESDAFEASLGRLGGSGAGEIAGFFLCMACKKHEKPRYMTFFGGGTKSKISLQKTEEDTEDGGTGSKRSLRTVLESSVEDGLLAPTLSTTIKIKCWHPRNSEETKNKSRNTICQVCNETAARLVLLVFFSVFRCF